MTKFLGLGILFFFLASMQLSAQKCKFDYEKEDPLTGAQTKGNTFTVKVYWKIGFNKVGDKYTISMWLRMNGQVRDIITPENNIVFKLENGEIITVFANDSYVGRSQATQNGVLTVYDAIFAVSEDDIKKLAASPLTYVRMPIGALTAESELNTKKGAEFQGKAKCILQ